MHHFSGVNVEREIPWDRYKDGNNREVNLSRVAKVSKILTKCRR